MVKRDINLTCRHCFCSYDEEGQDYGNYNTGLCFKCFEEDQEDHSDNIYRRRARPIHPL